MTQSQQHNTYDDRRSKRQSRLTRELVSTQDVTVPAVPTAEWQDQLYHRLSNPPSSGIAFPRTSYSSSSEPTRLTAWSSSNSTSPLLSMPTSLPGMSGEPSRRRRRLDTAYVPSDIQHPTQSYDQIGKSERVSWTSVSLIPTQNTRMSTMTPSALSDIFRLMRIEKLVDFTHVYGSLDR